MSTLDTDAIAARLKNATPGPWESDGKVDGWWGGERPAVRVGHSVPSRPGLSAPLCMVGADNRSRPVSPEADAEFIAAAPGDIAALLAEVATLRALLVRAERLILDEWDGTSTGSEGNVWLADYVRVSRLTEEPK